MDTYLVLDVQSGAVRQNRDPGEILELPHLCKQRWGEGRGTHLGQAVSVLGNSLPNSLEAEGRQALHSNTGSK